MRALFFRLEIVSILIAAGLLLRMVPFRVDARLLGAARSPEPLPASSPEARPRALSLGRSIDRFAERLPWRSSCLVGAGACRLMLRRRGIGPVVRFGVEGEGSAIAAHAWVMVGDDAVLGGRTSDRFRPIADFVARTGGGR